MYRYVKKNANNSEFIKINQKKDCDLPGRYDYCQWWKKILHILWVVIQVRDIKLTLHVCRTLCGIQKDLQWKNTCVLFPFGGRHSSWLHYSNVSGQSQFSTLWLVSGLCVMIGQWSLCYDCLMVSLLWLVNGYSHGFLDIGLKRYGRFQFIKHVGTIWKSQVFWNLETHLCGKWQIIALTVVSVG